MSQIYNIRNLTSCQDLQAKRKEFFKTLKLQQKLNRNYEQAVISRGQMEKLGITPITQPPRSLEEERKDLLMQQQLAMKNLNTIMRPEESQQVVKTLNASEIYSLNSEWGRLSKLLEGRSNITADFLRHVFQRYMVEVERRGGLAISIPLDESTLARLPGDLIDDWQNWSRQTIDPLTSQIVSLTDLIRQTAEVLNRPLAEIQREVQAKQEESGEIAEPKETAPPAPSARPSGRRAVGSSTAPRRSTDFQQLMGEADEMIQSMEQMGRDLPLPTRSAVGQMSEAEVKRYLTAYGLKTEGALTQLRGRLRSFISQQTGTFLTPTEEPSTTTFVLTRSNIERARKSVLQEVLEQIGLDAKGNVDELRERLLQFAEPDPLPGRPTPAVAPAKDEEEEGSGLYMGARPMSDFSGTRASYHTVGSGAVPPHSAPGGAFRTVALPPSTRAGALVYNKSSKLVCRNGKILGKVGRGIKSNGELKEYSRFREFGRYYIHVPSLNKSMINVVYPSRMAIPDFPSKFVSQGFIRMVENILDTGVWDKSQYNALSEEEQDYFVMLARKCQFNTTIGMGARLTRKESEDYARFELLKGTVIAGNNSPEVLKELKSYILRFLNDGRLPKKVGHDLLYEIACL